MLGHRRTQSFYSGGIGCEEKRIAVRQFPGLAGKRIFESSFKLLCWGFLDRLAKSWDSGFIRKGTDSHLLVVGDPVA